MNLTTSPFTVFSHSRCLFALLRELLVLLQQINGQLFRKYLRIGRFIRGVCALSVVQRVRIVGLELFPSILNDALRHLHGKWIRIVSLIHHGNRLCQAEIALLRIYKINRKTVFFIRNRLLPESEADGNLAGAHFLERSGSGILQVVSHILIDESSRWSPTFS